MELYLFNKIRPFPVGWIAQPSLNVLIHHLFLALYHFALNTPECSPSSKLEKILHLCIFTNKNNDNSIVQDSSRGHATLQSLNKHEETKQQQRGRR